jgi:hypothetical protein
VIAATSRTPIIYLRQGEGAIKGQMCHDLKLKENVFEIESTSVRKIEDRIMDFYHDNDLSGKNISGSLNLLIEHYDEAIGIMKKTFKQ